MDKFGKALLFSCVLIAIDKLSYIHPIGHLNITPWNPPAALDVLFLYWAGIRLHGNVLRRQINGVSGVQGYTENYMHLYLLAGVQKTLSFSNGHTIELGAWVGGGEGGRMSLQIQPYDAITLNLGSEKISEASISWLLPKEQNDKSYSRVRTQLKLRTIETGESGTSTLLKNGQLTSSTVSQPRTVQKNLMILFGLEHRW